ncbi:MgtC/SapB family protein [Burkholderia reimsis]|uniref:Protein MgtC n=1 Tax=Burkholderia reimsis TaxID=2234132 RepID=A0A365QW30_9BURK|nr:MgtC/SapB family protein [Burkholderia reimsis]RBB38635.1 MgtC/SapB family protein [Burkholderia reimsis]
MIGHLELLGRLLLAALLGSVIGLERERLNWAAGLRTHMLVCVGSALVMLVSTFGFEDVRGLTTAASLWAVAGVGLATGGGMYMASIGATAIVLAILAGVKPLERRFIAQRQQRTLRLVAERGGLTLGTLHEALGLGRVRVKRYIVQQSDDDPDTDDISVSFSRTSGPEFAAICETLQSIACVRTCQPDTASRSFA